MCFNLCYRSIIAFVQKNYLTMILFNVDLICADPSGFILFPLVIHSFDLIISSVGIFSIRGTRDSGVKSPIEDPMMILQKGYSITIVLAVLTFGLVRFLPPLNNLDFYSSWLWLLFYFSFSSIMIVFLFQIDQQIFEACNSLLITVVIIIFVY